MPLPKIPKFDIPDLRGENPSPDADVSLVTTRDGIKVYGLEQAKMELEFIVSEILQDNEYFEYGIRIPAGGVVVDVGEWDLSWSDNLSPDHPLGTLHNV